MCVRARVFVFCSPAFEHLSLLNTVEKLLLSLLLSHLLQPRPVLFVPHQIVSVSVPEHFVLRGRVRIRAGGGAVALRVGHLACVIVSDNLDAMLTIPLT